MGNTRSNSLLEYQNIEGKVFDIERYATEDGPGIRTVVFLKGCPLSCKWCANPEALSGKTQVMFYASLCHACNKCIENCPNGAIQKSEKFGLITNQNKCTGCGLCEQNCYFSARKLTGKSMTAKKVMDVVIKDQLFYETSGGGITISGGEPFLQPLFLQALLQLSKKSGIHTAIETCGMIINQDVLEKTLPLLDLVYFDIKHVDKSKLMTSTGADGSIILDNVKKICEMHQNVVVRIPCIPTFNQTKADMNAIFAFLKTLGSGLKRVEILPYHRLGKDKYACLGLDYAMGDIDQLDKDDLLEYVSDAEKMGLTVCAGAK
jgi:pyruvate formate lyase activating enzyme